MDVHRQAPARLAKLPRLGLRAREQLWRHAAPQHLVGGRQLAPLERLAIVTKQARPLALACQWGNGEDLACRAERKEAAVRRETRRVGLRDQHQLLSLNLGHARAKRALCRRYGNGWRDRRQRGSGWSWLHFSWQAEQGANCEHRDYEDCKQHRRLRQLPLEEEVDHSPLHSAERSLNLFLMRTTLCNSKRNSKK